MAAHVFHQCYFHIVWATKQRCPWITEDVREWLVACIVDAAKERTAEVLACNAMPDHVHLYVSLPPTVLPFQFVGQVKGKSSHAFRREFGPNKPLTWQNGYSILTTRKSDIAVVVHYIENQQEIHATRKTWPSLEATPSDEEPA